jgi:hypothetical protein
MSDIEKGDWVEFIGPAALGGAVTTLIPGSAYHVKNLYSRRVGLQCMLCDAMGGYQLILTGEPKYRYCPCVFRPLKKPPGHEVLRCEPVSESA